MSINWQKKFDRTKFENIQLESNTSFVPESGKAGIYVDDDGLKVHFKNDSLDTDAMITPAVRSYSVERTSSLSLGATATTTVDVYTSNLATLPAGTYLVSQFYVLNNGNNGNLLFDVIYDNDATPAELDTKLRYFRFTGASLAETINFGPTMITTTTERSNINVRIKSSSTQDNDREVLGEQDSNNFYPGTDFPVLARLEFVRID